MQCYGTNRSKYTVVNAALSYLEKGIYKYNNFIVGLLCNAFLSGLPVYSHLVIFY